jgi:deoxyribonuclease-4
MKRLLGAHMPTKGGLHTAVINGHDIGCSCVQIFTSSPQQWGSKPITDEIAEAMAEAKRATKIDSLVSHDSYLVNLAASDPAVRKRSISTLIGEMHRCSRLGIGVVVSHMGSHLGDGEDVGLRRLAEGARDVLNEAPDDVVFAMETTAGQGTNLGYKFEHVAFVIEHCKAHASLACCMDTCHIFAAGYDLRTAETYENTMRQFDKTIGFDKLRCIHLNDSQKEFGSRKDRHAHIGEGCIGETAFRLIVNDKRFSNIPMIIETPDAETMHKVNLDRLKSFIK